MKKRSAYALSAILSIVFIASFTGCKECKKCHTELMGIKSPPQEYCGDDLEKVEKTPAMVCEDK